MAAGLGGCRDPRRIPHAGGSTTAPAIDLHDPAATARAFLDACATLGRIGRKGMLAQQDRDSFKQADATVSALADRSGIEQQWSANWGRDLSEASKQNRIDKIIKNWPSIVAHYVDTLVRDSSGSIAMRVDSPFEGREGRTVRAHAVADEPGGGMEPIRREVAQMKNVRNEPLVPGSEEYEIQVHRRAAMSGISPTPGAAILVTLRETGEGWKVLGVELGPPPARATTQPGVDRAASAGSAIGVRR